jgi:hypothetical protein
MDNLPLCSLIFLSKSSIELLWLRGGLAGLLGSYFKEDLTPVAGYSTIDSLLSAIKEGFLLISLA